MANLSTIPNLHCPGNGLVWPVRNMDGSSDGCSGNLRLESRQENLKFGLRVGPLERLNELKSLDYKRRAWPLVLLTRVISPDLSTLPNSELCAIRGQNIPMRNGAEIFHSRVTVPSNSWTANSNLTEERASTSMIWHNFRLESPRVE